MVENVMHGLHIETLLHLGERSVHQMRDGHKKHQQSHAGQILSRDKMLSPNTRKRLGGSRKHSNTGKRA